MQAVPVAIPLNLFADSVSKGPLRRDKKGTGYASFCLRSFSRLTFLSLEPLHL